MILNLIIPVYNNYNGLINTIMSLNTYYSRHKVNIIVINDCSTDNKNYKHIANLFKQFYDIKIYTTPHNMGAGNARQYGLDKVNDNYVMFIDAGDIIYSPTEFIEYLNFVEQNPQTLCFSPAHFEQKANNECYTHSPSNNRIHGKIYQVSFLKKYNIRFYEKYPNMNEDIGFNLACRICCRYLQSINPNTQYYINYNTGIVVWTFDINSLTRIDDCAFYYKQNIGLSNHFIYAFNNLLEHGIPADFMQPDIAEVFVNLYVFYIGAVNIREEFINEAFTGTLEFYKHILAPYSLNTDVLTEKYRKIIGELLTYEDYSFSCKLPVIGILDFLLMLDKAYQSDKQREEGETND